VSSKHRGRGPADPPGEILGEVLPEHATNAVGPEQPSHGRRAYPPPGAVTGVVKGPPTGENDRVNQRFSGSLVLVYTTPSITDGYLARSRLEAEGIPVFSKGEAEGPYRMGPVHLYVPAELEVQAVLVIDEIRSGRFAVSEGDVMVEEIDWTQAESEPDPERSPD
jgi:hypothetical protein